MRKISIRFLLYCSIIVICTLNPFAGCTPADVEPLVNQYYFPRIMDLIKNAETSIKVVMYNVTWYEKYPDSPSNRIIKLLCDAVRKKIEVTVILNRDKKQGYITNDNKAAALILKNSGVRILYDPLDQTTHAKLLIIDNRYVVVGSFNWSYYSLEKK